MKLALVIALVAGLLLPTEATSAQDCSWKPGWVTRENAKGGTPGWDSDIPLRFSADFSRRKNMSRVEGYFDQTSIGCGQRAQLKIIGAASADLSIYRIGYYNGSGARLIMSIKSGKSFTATQSTPPGQYLIKLKSPGHVSTFVPLLIRGTSNNELTFISSVLTWQAYNQWGGASLYKGPDGKRETKADSVSFNRPYDGDGAGQFRYMEQPLVQMMEKLGLDINYLTDIDLDKQLSINSASIIFGGHSEYWTESMRAVIEKSISSGTNLLIFGGNTAYAKTFLTGRVLVNRIPYREIDKPESGFMGSQFFALGIHKDLEVQADSKWPFNTLGKGGKIQGIYGYEADTAMGTKGPGVEVFARAAISPTEKGFVAMSTYYSAASGAGVLNLGTNAWVCALANRCPWGHSFDAKNMQKVRLVTAAILKQAGRRKIGNWQVASIDIPTRN
ncbi:MAG: N,N-dimethylformamidase beta subunit family domain-containing protein [Actinomycetes bacterium]